MNKQKWLFNILSESHICITVLQMDVDQNAGRRGRHLAFSLVPPFVDQFRLENRYKLYRLGFRVETSSRCFIQAYPRHLQLSIAFERNTLNMSWKSVDKTSERRNNKTRLQSGKQDDMKNGYENLRPRKHYLNVIFT